MHVRFIGSGNVATALAQAAAGSGHTVDFAVRDTSGESVLAALAAVPGAAAVPLAGCAQGADVVVLATPAYVAGEVLAAVGDLGDTVLVDATNAFQGVPDGLPTMAALVADASQGGRLVKSFNVVGAEHMADPSLPGGQRVFMPVAGDDADAVAQVVALASDMGFDAHAVGPLASAVLLEDLARLWGAAAFGAGLGRGVAFALVRADSGSRPGGATAGTGGVAGAE